MLTATLSGLLALTLGLYFATMALAAMRLRRRNRQGTRPFVSLVRPICGVDGYERETLESSFNQDYPDYEIIFCAADEADPAVALTRELAAAHPDRQARVLVGDERISANPKLNNLVKGFDAAKADIVVMTDSNLMLTPDYLTTLDDAWTPDAGLVSAPAIGTRPDNFWGAVECAFLNGNQARWQLAADAIGLGFAQGKTLAWRRDVLIAGGGLPRLGTNLAEDVASTKLVRSLGRRVRLPAKLFAQPVGRRSAHNVWDRQLRWSRIRRDGFPAIFWVEIAQGPLVPALALAGLIALGVKPLWSAPLLAVAWYGAEWLLARAAGWPAGLRDLAAMVMRDLMLAPLWLATFGARDISWRGNAIAAKPPEK